MKTTPTIETILGPSGIPDIKDAALINGIIHAFPLATLSAFNEFLAERGLKIVLDIDTSRFNGVANMTTKPTTTIN